MIITKNSVRNIKQIIYCSEQKMFQSCTEVKRKYFAVSFFNNIASCTLRVDPFKLKWSLYIIHEALVDE